MWLSSGSMRSRTTILERFCYYNQANTKVIFEIQKAVQTTSNLHLFKWIAQNDLLADPRLTAFITHAGMGSTQEITLRGKPGEIGDGVTSFFRVHSSLWLWISAWQKNRLPQLDLNEQFISGLFIPVLGDQPRNAGAMERSGIGKVIPRINFFLKLKCSQVFDKRDLTSSDKFTAAVDDLLENERRVLFSRQLCYNPSTWP